MQRCGRNGKTGGIFPQGQREFLGGFTNAALCGKRPRTVPPQ